MEKRGPDLLHRSLVTPKVMNVEFQSHSCTCNSYITLSLTYLLSLTSYRIIKVTNGLFGQIR